MWGRNSYHRSTYDGTGICMVAGTMHGIRNYKPIPESNIQYSNDSSAFSPLSALCKLYAAAALKKVSGCRICVRVINSSADDLERNFEKCPNRFNSMDSLYKILNFVKS